MIQITIDGVDYRTKEIAIVEGSFLFNNETTNKTLVIKPKIELVKIKDLGPQSVTNIGTSNGNFSF